MKLTNDDADFLIKLQKKLLHHMVRIPSAGEYQSYPMKDLENIRDFTARMRLANGNRSDRKKATYILFYEKNIQLLRLDTYGTGVHLNSDGTIIPAHTPHIHIYDEIEGDHNAYPLPQSFANPSELLETLIDFFDYVNVVDVDKIQVIEEGVLDFE